MNIQCLDEAATSLAFATRGVNGKSGRMDDMEEWMGGGMDDAPALDTCSAVLYNGRARAEVTPAS